MWEPLEKAMPEDSPKRDPRAAIVHPSAFVAPGVELGDGVEIGAGCVILAPSRIADRCRIGAGCVFDPDGHGNGQRGATLEADVEVGAGTIVASPVRISAGARILAGSVVHRDVPPHAIISGNPAEIVGYTLSRAGSTAPDVELPNGPSETTTLVKDVTFHRLPRILDLRGNLTVGEFGRSLPFEPKRYFMVFGVPNAEVRGEHAHRTCKQFLICTHGSCSVVADDGIHRQEFVLDDPAIGLYLPPMTWGIQYKYSKDAVLLVFASEFYDAAEYIRDYDEFRRLSSAAEA